MSQQNETVSPLRQRMIEEMTMRKLSPKTQTQYIRGVKKLAAFLKRSPEDATAEELRKFQLMLAETGTSNITMNATLQGLRFLYCKALKRPEVLSKTSSVPEPRKLPNVLSVEEVKQLMMATTSVKYRAALSVAYGAGLRIGEVVKLKVSDIDSKRMLIRVEQGKGGERSQCDFIARVVKPVKTVVALCTRQEIDVKWWMALPRTATR